VSRRRRAVPRAYGPRRSANPEPTESTVPPEAEVIIIDPDKPIIPTLGQLRASARRARIEALARATPFLEIDQPRRAGQIDWHEGEDEIPEDVPADESPHDSARKTQNRRERRRKAMQPGGPLAVPESVIASASPSGFAELVAKVRGQEATWRRSSA